MLMITLSLVAKSAKSNPLIVDVSPMYLIWLVVTNQRLNQRIAEVDNPTTANLRRVGMMELAIQDERRALRPTSYCRLGQDDQEQELTYTSRGHCLTEEMALE